MKNYELSLAWEFVNNTNRTIFLTGKAGTGKTTFLHSLRSNSLKRMVVVAPTGVAAINAKGVTIHSFFQMPFGPILPDDNLDRPSEFSRKFSKTKINIIKSLDLLVIDEISMVRADLLDGIDKTLRRFRSKNEVFGGVQLLMIGDLQQLSPVIKENEWQLLKPFYKNAYFFSSQAFQQCNAITIELKHIYRQDNPEFIKILNEIRTNTLTQSSADELNKRYFPNFKVDEGYIALTTHNHKAERVNNEELEKLEAKPQTYYANVEGKFPEHSYPNKEELTFKVGAQVMFIKNDNDQEKRYFNGKIGKVVSLTEDEITVRCPEDDFDIIVIPQVWENINYSVNTETKAIIENSIGSFTQMPLRLAWSITIHKSQGLTFEKAIIDAEGAFAHGQTYVALSRCKSLEGLVLTSKIDNGQIINDSNVLSFNKQTEDNQPDDIVLQQSKAEFQLQLIFEVFNYYSFLYPIGRILDVYYKNRNSIQGTIEKPINTIKTCVTNFLKVNNTFYEQLKLLTKDNQEPENNPQLQKRFQKALAYFNSEFKTNISEAFKNFGFTTDNKTVEKDIVKHAEALDELITTKQLYFNGLKDAFNVKAFLELRAESVFVKDKPKKIRKSIIDSTENVELFEQLRTLRSQIAEDQNLIHYQIFNQKSLYEMCELLPTTSQQLKQINGMGKVRVEKYGDAILEVIIDFCKENDLEISNEIVIFEKPKKNKIDTKRVSLNLFKSGKSVLEIAKERDLTTNTITGHLASFIPSGEVKITDLISEENYKELKKIIPKKEFESLTDLKNQLDDKYSYSDLKLVLTELTQ